MRITILLAVLVIAGCGVTGQLARNTETRDFYLDPLALQQEGLGFLTPISATGQEADRVGLAIAFAERVADERADLHVLRLAEVLSAVNQAGLSDEYKTMMDDYQATGILERDTLRQIGEASGARYLGLLNLARFSQGSNKRFSIGGLRLMDTKEAALRLSWQIWDSRTGAIAWEGSDEINYAYDTGRERPVNFGYVAAQAATNMLAEFPTLADKAQPAMANLSAGR
ncbi:MAG: hypothetical protein OEW35_02455 [Gammaproteobacteria bacterium]|nr:hypothetical protein [Gammaproteobacteria bacterium]MDH4255471.1 hypothetical protein [Gammaproteobacteria bacterium]MDH5309514.1 hypothetical protein [Gammaproteobacteria bacterium]